MDIQSLLAVISDDAKNLTISGQALSRDDLSALMSKVHTMTQLRQLCLCNCAINDNEMNRLNQVLIPHPTLTSVDFSGNDITNYTILLNLVQNNPRINTIIISSGLDQDHIDGDQFTRFVAGLTKCSQLVKISLPYRFQAFTKTSAADIELANSFAKMGSLLEFTSPPDTYNISSIVSACEGNKRAATDILRQVLSSGPIQMINSTQNGVDRTSAVLSIAESQGQRQAVIEAFFRRARAGMADFSFNQYLFPQEADPNLRPDPIQDQAQEPTKEIKPAALNPDFDKTLPRIVFDTARAVLEESPDGLPSYIRNVFFDEGQANPLILFTQAASSKGSNPLHQLELLDTRLREQHGYELTPDDFLKLGPQGDSGLSINRDMHWTHAYYEQRISTVAHFFASKNTSFSLDALLIRDSSGKLFHERAAASSYEQSLFFSAFWAPVPDVLLAYSSYLKGQLKTSAQEVLTEIVYGLKVSNLNDLPKKFEPFDDGVTTTFSPILSADMKAALSAFSTETKGRPYDDVLWRFGLKNYGGVTGYHNLDAYLQEKHGISLKADHFCQSAKDGDNIGLAYFSYGRRAGSSEENLTTGTVIDFITAKNDHFSSKALLNKDREGETFLDACEAELTLHRLMTPRFWNGHEDTLRELLQSEVSQLQSFLVRHTLATLEGAPLPQRNNRPFQSRQTKLFHDLANKVLKECQISTSDAPLIKICKSGIAYMEKFSANLVEATGYPLSADDFISLLYNSSSRNVPYFFSRDDYSVINNMMSFLKRNPSCFSKEALMMINGEGNTLVKAAENYGVMHILFDNEYWKHFPETLSWIAQSSDPVHRCIKDCMADCGFSGSALPPSLPRPKSGDEPPALDELERRHELAELISNANLGTTEEISRFLADNPHDHYTMWTYGDDVIGLRREFAIHAMRLTTAGSLYRGTTELISEFLTNFSSAREILETHAQRMNNQEAERSPNGKSQDSSFGLGFLSRFSFSWKSKTEEDTVQIKSLSDALDMTRIASDNLLKVVPGFSEAEKAAARKMALFDSILEGNIVIRDALDRYIGVAEAFLSNPSEFIEKNATPARTATIVGAPVCQTSEITAQALDSANANNDAPALPVVQEQVLPRIIEKKPVSEIALGRLTEKVKVLKSVQASVDLEIANGHITGNVFCKQATDFSLQHGITAATLATSVGNLHSTLDVLVASTTSQSLSKASAVATQQQVRDLLLAAQQTMTAIENTVDSQRQQVLALDKQAIKFLTDKGLLQAEKATGLPSSEGQANKDGVIDIPSDIPTPTRSGSAPKTGSQPTQPKAA